MIFCTSCFGDFTSYRLKKTFKVTGTTQILNQILSIRQYSYPQTPLIHRIHYTPQYSYPQSPLIHRIHYTPQYSYPQTPLMGSCTLLSVSRGVKSLSVTLQSDSIKRTFTVITHLSITAYHQINIINHWIFVFIYNLNGISH